MPKKTLTKKKQSKTAAKPQTKIEKAVEKLELAMSEEHEHRDQLGQYNLVMPASPEEAKKIKKAAGKYAKAVTMLNQRAQRFVEAVK